MGKHVLVLMADREADGCIFEETRIGQRSRARNVGGDKDLAWLGWLIAIGVVVGLVILSAQYGEWPVR